MVLGSYDVNTEAMDTALDALFADDEASMKEFIGLCINDLQVFSVNYKNALLSMDLPELREVTHKYKSVHKLLGLDILVNEAENGKTMLASTSSKESLEKSTSTVAQICDLAIKHLQAKG